MSGALGLLPRPVSHKRVYARLRRAMANGERAGVRGSLKREGQLVAPLTRTRVLVESWALSPLARGEGATPIVRPAACEAVGLPAVRVQSMHAVVARAIPALDLRGLGGRDLEQISEVVQFGLAAQPAELARHRLDVVRDFRPAFHEFPPARGMAQDGRQRHLAM